MRTRTSSHLSAFAPEPAGSLFLPLLSHFSVENVTFSFFWNGEMTNYL
jgi:hypothetical protein